MYRLELLSGVSNHQHRIVRHGGHCPYRTGGEDGALSGGCELRTSLMSDEDRRHLVMSKNLRYRRAGEVGRDQCTDANLRVWNTSKVYCEM